MKKIIRIVSLKASFIIITIMDRLIMKKTIQLELEKGNGFHIQEMEKFSGKIIMCLEKLARMTKKWLRVIMFCIKCYGNNLFLYSSILKG